MKNNTRSIASAAITGAAYAVLTILLAPISYGAVQFRVSEVLCVLPYFLPVTSWGLFLGCLAANIFTGNVFDIVFGSLATLLAALCTAAVGKRPRSSISPFLAAAMPVIFNSLIVGALITRAYNGISILGHPAVFFVNAAQIALGEAAVMLVLGLPVMRWMSRSAVFYEFIHKIDDERRRLE